MSLEYIRRKNKILPETFKPFIVSIVFTLILSEKAGNSWFY